MQREVFRFVFLLLFLYTRVQWNRLFHNRIAVRNRKLSVVFMLIWILWLFSAFPKLMVSFLQKVFGVLVFDGYDYDSLVSESTTSIILTVSDFLFKTYSFVNSFIIVVLIKPFHLIFLRIAKKIKQLIRRTWIQEQLTH